MSGSVGWLGILLVLKLKNIFPLQNCNYGIFVEHYVNE